MKFEIADLPGWYLGEAGDERIRVDSDAGGNGWFIDQTGLTDEEFPRSGDIPVAGSNATAAEPRSSTTVTGMSPLPVRRYTDATGAPAGRIDLLTAILHEMGHALGLCDSYAEQDRDGLMYGFLTKGERRLPSRRDAAAATVLGGVPHVHPHFLTTPLNIGDLPAGKTVTITYVVTINPATTAISTSSQGTVSGANIANKLTNDPQTATADDATVTPIQQPPVVSNVAVAVNEDTTLTLTAANFTGSYSDPNSDALTSVRIISLPANGTLKVGAANATVGQDVPAASLGTITFVPAQDFNGVTSFTWNASDGTTLAVTPALVNITVNPVNDTPVLAGIEATSLPYIENQAATPISATLTVADVDGTLASATVSITGNYANGQDVLGFAPQPGITGTFNPATGTLTLTGSATVAVYQATLRAVTYSNTSETPSILARTVSIQVNDGAATGNLSNIVTRGITVTSVNDDPTPGPDTILRNAAASAKVLETGLLANDTDLDGDTPLTITGVNTPSPNGADDHAKRRATSSICLPRDLPGRILLPTCFPTEMAAPPTGR